MIIFFILAMMDFSLTYFAIKHDLAFEFNKIIAWSFQYSLIPCLLIRLAFMSALLIPFYLWARKRANYKRMVRLLLIIESVVVVLHLQWIIPAIYYLQI
jgi:hypothetical protein